MAGAVGAGFANIHPAAMAEHPIKQSSARRYDAIGTVLDSMKSARSVVGQAGHGGLRN